MAAPLTLACEGAAGRAGLEALSRQLGAALLPAGAPIPPPEPGGLLLVRTADRLELRSDLGGPVHVDLGPDGARTAAHADPLLGAFRTQRHPLRTIVDATAGLGQDAAALARAGYRVTACERSPVLALLLADGLRRLKDDHPDLFAPLAARLEVVAMESRTFLTELPEADRPDAVYLDPMHPPRRKSAAVRKDMRVLQRLLGGDLDATELLEVALRVARRRVVVKRPRHAEPLGTDVPALQRTGARTRYDIYVHA